MISIRGYVVEAKTGRSATYGAYAQITSTTEQKQPEEGNRAKVDPMATNPAQDTFAAYGNAIPWSAPAGTKRTLVVDVTGGDANYGIGFGEPSADGITFTGGQVGGDTSRHAEWTFVY